MGILLSLFPDIGAGGEGPVVGQQAGGCQRLTTAAIGFLKQLSLKGRAAVSEFVVKSSTFKVKGAEEALVMNSR